MELLEDAQTCGVQYGQTGTGKTHTMLGVDMWKLADADSASPIPPGASSAADAVASGALQPGTAAFDGVVERLMDYDGDFHPDWGLIPRAMAYLFRKLQATAPALSSPPSAGKRRSKPTVLSPLHTRLPEGVRVTVSYLEIYNEKVFDLLNPEVSSVPRDARVVRGKPGATGLDIVNDQERGVCVPEAVTVPVSNEAEVLALLWEGARNRVLASTDMNEHSSRSHTIWQVHIEQKHRAPPSGQSPLKRASPGDEDTRVPGEESLTELETVISRSKVSFVDLAGSEKIRPHTLDSFTDRRLTELTAINQSLSCLGNCIRALASRSRTHIPYRDSKLTRLLQDSLGGNCKTHFIVTVSPSMSCIDETISTLQFADRAKRVEVHAERNETLDEVSLVRRYKAEVARLRKELASRPATTDAEAGATPTGSHEELESLRAEVTRWKAASNRFQEEAISARAARRRVIQAASAAARADTTPGQSRALSAAMTAVDEAQKELDERGARLHSAEGALLKQSTACRALYQWLKGQSPAKDTPAKLRLMERQVQSLMQDVQDSKNKFQDDLDRALSAMARAETEAEVATHEASWVKASPSPAEEERDGFKGLSAEHAALAKELLAQRLARDHSRSMWTHHVDRRTQRSYWHNAENGATQWDRPVAWETSGESSHRLECLGLVTAFKDQQTRLLKAVTDQLEAQLSKIVQARGTVKELADEIARYRQETTNALCREADMLAAAMQMR
jgi:hypothetical protein